MIGCTKTENNPSFGHRFDILSSLDDCPRFIVVVLHLLVLLSVDVQQFGGGSQILRQVTVVLVLFTGTAEIVRQIIFADELFDRFLVAKTNRFADIVWEHGEDDVAKGVQKPGAVVYQGIALPERKVLSNCVHHKRGHLQIGI